MWLLEPFLWVLFGFLAVECHFWLERRRALPPEERKTLDQVVRSVLPQEKGEYMLPMNDEEYEKHLDDLSGRGGLMEAVKAKMPWRSKHQNSPSSDS